MLVFTRRAGEDLVLGGALRVRILAVEGSQVHLGLESAAPSGEARARPADNPPVILGWPGHAPDYPPAA